MSKELQNKILFQQVVTLLQNARLQVLRNVNSTMTYTYFEIGRMIVEEEQNGKERAEYGKQILKGLSGQLTKEFGKGFSVRNLEQIRRFFLIYSKSETLSRILQIPISQTVSAKLENSKTKSVISFSENSISKLAISFFKLTWTHYVFLMRIDDEKERRFYEIESEKYNWSVRELKRQYDSALYTRLTLSRDKKGILELSEKGQIIENPKDIIKDPYILEFLGLPELHHYSETELEVEIINKLEHFLLELGHGFTLKIGELKHQDLGQMQMYVNYYDREMRLEEENKTIGIVLCQNKSDLVIEYTLPENNEQIFASKYKTVLPSKEDLIKLIIK